jgi:DNA-binding transcriptional ArsR family regulator
MARGTGLNEPAAAHLPVLVDPRLVRGLSHVLRQHILLATLQREISPNELSKALGEGLSQVSYHVKVLREDCDGLIEQTRTEPRRGAVEHYYRASAKTLLPASTWRRLKKGLRAVVGAGLASDLFNDLADALKAGKLQGAHDHIARTPLVLDAEGQRTAAIRMAKANGNGGKAVGYTFALLAFEAAWEPADLHALVAHVEGSAPESANGANGAHQNGGGSKRARGKAGASSK